MLVLVQVNYLIRREIPFYLCSIEEFAHLEDLARARDWGARILAMRRGGPFYITTAQNTLIAKSGPKNGPCARAISGPKSIPHAHSM